MITSYKAYVEKNQLTGSFGDARLFSVLKIKLRQSHKEIW